MIHISYRYAFYNMISTYISAHVNVYLYDICVINKYTYRVDIRLQSNNNE
jgi:hypothetical protein